MSEGRPKVVLARLDRRRAARIASLIGIGRQSGDTVVGLDRVRRAKGIAFIFLSSALARRTLNQLADRTRDGTQVFAVEDIEVITRGFGRPEISVIGIKTGPLAKGIGRKLAEED